MVPAPTDLRSFQSLKEIVAALRGPQGCPWDKDQTHQSLTPFAIEEVFEFVEAIDTQNDSAIKEELGDVMFQVILHAQLAQERQAFTIDDVIEELNSKMVRRHPHVFGTEVAITKDDVLNQWEVIKSKEKTRSASSVSANPFNIPTALPALQRSYKIGLKTKKVGFDWTHVSEVKEKILEELAEVDEAIESTAPNKIEEELGDLLFTVAQYARHLGFEPETCLRKSNLKFENRYSMMLELCRQSHTDFSNLDLDTKEKLWRQAKEKLATS